MRKLCAFCAGLFSLSPRLAFAVVQHETSVGFVAIVQISNGLIGRRSERLIHVQELWRPAGY